MHQQPPTRFFPPPRPPGLTTQPPEPTNDLQRGHFHHCAHHPTSCAHRQPPTRSFPPPCPPPNLPHPPATSNEVVPLMRTTPPLLSSLMACNEVVSSTAPTTSSPALTNEVFDSFSPHSPFMPTNNTTQRLHY